MAFLGHITIQFLYCSIVVLFFVGADAQIQTLDKESVRKASEKLIRHYSQSHNNVSTSAGLTAQEFVTFLDSVTSHSKEFIQKVIGACSLTEDNNCTGNIGKCPGIDEIFQSFAIDERLPPEGLIDALPVALNTLTSENCTKGSQEKAYHARKKRRPSMGEAWGYGIGFVSSVVIISNTGACLGPIMEKRFFKRLLQFLVAMGAGSLASTGLLVLIPEAFEVNAVDELNGYVWKSTVAIISIYVFFCLERILKTVFYQRKVKFQLKTNMSISVSEPQKNGVDGQTLEPLTDKKDSGHGHSHLPPRGDQADGRRTLAWMIMAGDVIHKIVDGLSIGAAFTEDVTLGISISLAVICEELPHELADIAILLHSGLSIKKSLFINCLSGCACYIGLVLGILLGSMVQEASKWIFAMAGGLFLYIPLVDMLPDMSAHLDILLSHGSNEARIVAGLHTCGLVIGAGIVVFIVNISAYIVVD